MTEPMPLIPEIPQEQITPLIKLLLEILQRQTLEISHIKEEKQKLKDEIALLKKGNPKYNRAS